MGNKMCAHGCEPRKVSGLVLTQHVGRCPWAPIGACPDCGHDIVRGEASEHEDCDINFKEVVNDLLLPYPNDVFPFPKEVVHAA